MSSDVLPAIRVPDTARHLLPAGGDDSSAAHTAIPMFDMLVQGQGGVPVKTTALLDTGQTIYCTDGLAAQNIEFGWSDDISEVQLLCLITAPEYVVAQDPNLTCYYQ